MALSQSSLSSSIDVFLNECGPISLLLHHRLKVLVWTNPHGEHDGEEHEFFGGAHGYRSSGYTGIDFNSMAFT
jgi:hypothetical protein